MFYSLTNADKFQRRVERHFIFSTCEGADTNLAGECIKCFVGNVTEAKPENLVDCDNLGIQREELYCRNITIYQNGGENSPIESVQRSCVAMSWY